MPNPGAFEVGQRRFWNALQDSPGVIYIGSWGSIASPGCNLWASDDGAGWSLVYTGPELATGILPFPAQFKLCRFWRMTYENYSDGGAEVDWDGTNEWILKPYSTDMDLVGPNAWNRGSDWRTANLFFDSSPFAIPTSLHYVARLEGSPVHGGYFEPYASGFGAGGLLYGYLNDVYFGNNEMGGNKPNVGVGPKKNAVGDLSKGSVGLWGAFGISHGYAPSGYSVQAEWIFDLCDRAEAAATAASLSLGNQSEGWGTDVAPVVVDSHGHRTFTLSTSPARGTLNVYTPKGLMLMRGLDYDNCPCDTTGRVYCLLRNLDTPCNSLGRVIVTYLVMAAALRQAKRTARTVDTNVGSNRLDSLDIRGL